MNANLESHKRFFLTCALHVAILVQLAIAHPLLQKLSENPEFLIAHQATSADIVWLVAILCFALPALLVALELLAKAIGVRVLNSVHLALVFLLFVLLLLLAIHSFDATQEWIALAIAIVSAASLTALYKVKLVRSTFSYLAPVLLIVPSLFVFNGSIRGLLSPRPISVESGTEHGSASIVMVVFDELPISSLMNEDRLLDRVLFPNFASLLQDFTWYRNTTTVSPTTTMAVPAIITGKYPQKDLKPTLADHPENLFTLLGRSHELKVVETVTSLCPPRLNVLSREISTNNLTRLRLTLSDLAAVYLQMIIPPVYAQYFPDVTMTWGNFWDTEDTRKIKKRDRTTPFKIFLHSITPSERAFFSFLHISLPHRPWIYLPDGTKYRDYKEGLRADKFWEEDEWGSRIAVQRHLLQLAYADQLLGQLMQQLKQTGLYDRCMIVIVADHGISLWEGEESRKPTPSTLQDILFVPFFIKAPFQKKGAIIDKDLETIDIVPTMLSTVGIAAPWKFDGTAASAVPADRKRHIWFREHLISNLRYDISDENRTLERKIALFGNANRISDLYNIGPFPELVDRHVKELPISSSEGVSVTLRKKEAFENVDPSSNFIPAYVAGDLNLAGSKGEVVIAIAINEKIRAITKAFHSGSKIRFSALVPPTSFIRGKNKVDIFVLSPGDRWILAEAQ